jgi:hypothetical protein
LEAELNLIEEVIHPNPGQPLGQHHAPRRGNAALREVGSAKHNVELCLTGLRVPE